MWEEPLHIPAEECGFPAAKSTPVPHGTGVDSLAAAAVVAAIVAAATAAAPSAAAAAPDDNQQDDDPAAVPAIATATVITTHIGTSYEREM